MKNEKWIFGVFALLFFLSSCQKESPNPYGTGNGDYTFWTQTDLGVGNINVFIDNESVGTMSHFYANGITCGQGDVNVLRTAGSHTFRATTSGAVYWSGTVTFEEGKCKSSQLTYTGGGGGGCDWTSAVNCVSIVNTARGTRCTGTQSFEITLKNTCSQNLKMFVCLQRTDGTWYGLPDGTFSTGMAPNETANWYVCQGTGSYKIFAMPVSIFNTNSCALPSCN